MNIFFCINFFVLVLNMIAIHAYSPIYKGCELKESDFTLDTLVDFRNDDAIRLPIQLVLDSVTLKDGTVGADVYWINIRGSVKRLKAEQSKVEVLGKYIVHNGSDHGLVGLELDPNFKTNGWMWFRYSPKAATPADQFLAVNKIRVSRVTLKGDKLDFETEKIIWEGAINPYKMESLPEFGRAFNMIHQGGGMAFDREGNLWFNIGNNSVDMNLGYKGSHFNPEDARFGAVGGSGNTASPVGSILKIKPIGFSDSESPQVGKGSTYTIPSGNFGEYFSQYWNDQGDNDLSEQYLDESLVLPEIYVKGIRSIFSINVDPYYGWVSWGEVNGDGADDEFHIVKHPIFSGHPWYGGWSNIDTLNANKGHNMHRDSIFNLAPINLGVKRLPPITNPTIPRHFSGEYGEMHYDKARSAMGGPIYHYNGKLNSKSMFPPHYNNMWFIVDWQKQYKWAVDLDTTGSELTHVNAVEFFPNLLMDRLFNRLLDIEFGPDNALYFADMGNNSGNAGIGYGRIVRFRYNQKCSDSELLPPKPGPISIVKKQQNEGVRLIGNKAYVSITGTYRVKIYSIQGKLLGNILGKGIANYDLLPYVNARQGVFFISIKSEFGETFHKSGFIHYKN